MRVNALILVLAIGALSGVAHAEKVKTNQSTKVFLHPGEQEKVLFTLKSGQNMTLLATEGRWLKVRVHGRTGYVPRTKVDLPDGDEIVRNTRRRPFVDGRSTKRGFGGEQGPDDRIGADAVGEGDDAGSGDSSDSDGGAKDGDDDGGSKAHGDKASGKHGKSHAKQADSDDGDGDDGSGDDDGGHKATRQARRGDDGSDSDADSGSDSDSDSGSGSDSDSDDGDKGGDGKVTDDGGGGDDGGDDRPIAHVTEKTRILAERDPDSDEQFVARPKDILYPSEQKGKWTFVEDDEGDGGWVLTDKLDMGDTGGGTHKRQIDLRARLGFMFVSQGMRSANSMFQPGTAPIDVDNYNISTSALDLALGGGVLFPYGKNYLLGGEATLDYAKTLLGGIAVPMQAATTTFGITDVNLRAMAGYDLHKKNGLAVFARLGYRYQGFIVDNYKDPAKNSAKIPNEVFQAPVIGAAVAIPKLTDKIGLRAVLDTSLFGVGITQTKGFEDGSKKSAMAVCVEAGVTYHWKKDIDLQGLYDLNYDSIDFGAPLMTSQRGHTGTDTRRTDFFHTLTFGITKAF